MKQALALLALLLPGMPMPDARADAPTEQPALTAEHRVVFLGDSITDGHSYILALEHAYAQQQPGNAPALVNAGAGGDTAALMRRRLEADVVERHPTHVVLMAGVNDAMRRVALDDYRAHVTAIADALAEPEITLILATPSRITGQKHAAASDRLTAYAEFLRSFASARGLRLADVQRAFDEALAADRDVLESDQIHPNAPGQQLIAQAMLGALGLAGEAPDPRTLEVQPEPGLVKQWRIRALSDDETLTAEAASHTEPDQDWHSLALPTDTPQGHWWQDQEQQRGMAVNLNKHFEGERFLAAATVESDANKRQLMRLGGAVERAYLNGQRVYQKTRWAGWHPGAHRVVIDLNKGGNTILLETGSAFVVTLTDVPLR